MDAGRFKTGLKFVRAPLHLVGLGLQEENPPERKVEKNFKTAAENFQRKLEFAEGTDIVD